ncbi:MAG: glycerol-3-phosphate dehydrogenase/oxidase [Candidatus Sericytochromatia bacterium]
MAKGFSYRNRRDNLQKLAGDTVDLIVIGGGVTGAGMALDAALRGLRVVVLEKQDFANGASSKSSKLLHGGLRYLEHAEFKLVFESLAQRNHLLEDVPHLATPLEFLFPTFEGGKDKGWVIGAGLTVYDLLSAMSDWKETRWHKRLTADQTRDAEPAIRYEGLRGAHRYMDGVTEDARLVVETVKSAVEAGAIALNYVEVTGLIKDEAGKVTGVSATDTLSGRTLTLNARRVFNACGPWADAIRRLDEPNCRRRLRPTKGVHLLTEAFVHHHAVVMRSVEKEGVSPRVVFVIPWGGRTLIGTTDTDHEGDPDDFSYLDQDVEASPEEVRYLLDAVNATFAVELEERDVISTYAGWRPLVAPPDGSVSESAISREYEIFTSASGLMSIAGGKLTAFRAMARHAVDHVVRSLKEETPSLALKPSAIEHWRLSGSELPGQPFNRYVEETLKDSFKLPKALVATLVNRYGSNWPGLRNLIACDERLSQRIEGLSSHLSFYWVEPVYAVEYEGAVSRTSSCAAAGSTCSTTHRASRRSRSSPA